MNRDSANTWTGEVKDSIREAVVTDEEFLNKVMTGIMAKGHVLIEDVPGTGKTLTANSLAKSMNLSFNRIQFTPDLLPSDITGSHVYNDDEGDFEFKEGPIFANIVLADEINRAPPKTQAALLEAMGEKQVSVDDRTIELPEPFFVIATQNPVEHEGTFELPEAQRDRFMIKTSMGYPDREGEKTILSRRADRTSQTPEATPVSDSDEILDVQEVVEGVEVSKKIRDYIVDLAKASRSDERVAIGLSPRGVQRLFESSRARALIQGRNFVVPDDVKYLIGPVLRHRLVLTSESEVREVEKNNVVNDIVDEVEVPEVD